MKFNLGKFRIFIAFLMPLFAVFGFVNGCVKSADEPVVRTLLMTGASATMSPSTLTLHFRYVPSMLAQWPHIYTNLVVASLNAPITLNPPTFTAPASDIIQVSIVTGLGAGFGKVVEDPTTGKIQGIEVSRLVAFVSSFMGYLPGNYVAMNSGAGVKQEIASNLVKDEEFRTVAADYLYELMAIALIQSEGHGKRVSTEDATNIVAFLRLSKVTENDRASIHALIWKYASQPSTRDAVIPSASGLSIACMVLSVFGAIVWLVCIAQIFDALPQLRGHKPTKRSK